MLSIFMTVYRRTEFTDKTLKSILENKNDKIELVIWIDGQDPETYQKAKDFVSKWDQKNWIVHGFAPCWKNPKFKTVWLVYLRNIAFEICTEKNIFIINDDIEVSKWYDTAIEKDLETEKFVCPYFTEWENAFQWEKKKRATNISGHARATQKKFWDTIWPIDWRLNLWFSDDYIFRQCVDKWNRPYWTENVVVHHYRSKTIEDPKNEEFVEKKIAEDKKTRMQILKEKWRFDPRFDHLLF